MTTTEQIVTGVDFVAIPTKDLEAADRFYRETLALPRSVHKPEMGFSEYETGAVTLSVILPEKFGLEYRPNTQNAIALQVDDVPAARATLEERGVEFAAETLDTSVCHMAFFSDPDGNAFMLHHRYAPRVSEA